MLGERRVNVPKAASTRRPQIKPKLGQHFLAGEEYAPRIVDALGDVSQSTVLEIGPGRGIITALLANRARRLIAVELDRAIVRKSDWPSAEVHDGAQLEVVWFVGGG